MHKMKNNQTNLREETMCARKCFSATSDILANLYRPSLLLAMGQYMV